LTLSSSASASAGAARASASCIGRGTSIIIDASAALDERIKRSAVRMTRVGQVQRRDITGGQFELGYQPWYQTEQSQLI
jgi:hypothetical protein